LKSAICAPARLEIVVALCVEAKLIDELEENQSGVGNPRKIAVIQSAVRKPGNICFYAEWIELGLRNDPRVTASLVF